MSLSSSLQPFVSPITQILSSPIIKTPFTKSIQKVFTLTPSPFVEKNNDNSPIFNMSPLSLVKFAEIIDIASSYGAIIENKVELPPLPSMSSISSLTSTSSLSISPPKINIIPLTSLSSMKNSLYERRMKAKEQQEK